MPFFFFNHPSWFHWPHMFGQPAFNFQIAQKALAPLYREFSRKSHLDLRDARRKGHVHPWAADNHGTSSQIAEGKKCIGFQIGRAWLETSDVTNRALPSLSSRCLKIISSFPPGIAVFLQGFPWTWFTTKTHRVQGSGLWLRVCYKRWGLEGYLQGDCVCLVFLGVFLHSGDYFS